MAETGQEAVARKMCEILERRYPGTTWLPVNDDEIQEGDVVRWLATEPACRGRRST